MAKYAIRKAEQRMRLPEIDLLPVISHNGQSLDVAVFGCNSYRGNVAEMQQEYFHSAQLPNITFRPAYVNESISIASNGFKNLIKPKIFQSNWLQAGYIVRTQDGVFTNITETFETRLKQLLNGAEKVNGIYLLDNGIAFVPYSTFVTGIQSVGDFARNPKTNGLARGLEFSRGRAAPKLSEIGSKKHYKEGVDVFGWDSSDEPLVKVASLYSDDDRLGVGGDWGDDGYGGFAFGVLDESRKDNLKK